MLGGVKVGKLEKCASTEHPSKCGGSIGVYELNERREPGIMPMWSPGAQA